jgi:two-component system LytT family sensor kinase
MGRENSINWCKFVITMKKLSPEYFLDQRRLVSHILFFIIAVIAVFVVSWKEGISNSFSVKLRFFLLLFIQLEVFLFIASKLFTGLKTGMTRSEITGIIVSRFVLFIIACFISAFIIFLLFKYIDTWILQGDMKDVLNQFLVYEFNGWFKSTIGGLTFGAIVFIVIQWQDALKREQKLREENLIFQNETLKNQVNPHFLFNSLNTLSALVSTNPETAEKFINRLASVYRYILENSRKDKVPLQSELEFIRDYFELHKIRDGEKILLKTDAPEPGKYEILPVSLQILVENAIKHNMATRENPLFISIYIENKSVIVRNNLQKMGVQLQSTKIGLRNLAERVRLTTGSELIIEETNSEFIVKIPLIV